MTVSYSTFWDNVDVRGEDECWEWRGDGWLQGGYGKAVSVITGRTTTAHKVAWEITNGPVSKGLYVCHHCDNPPCCNPAHLFVGTPKKNMQDARDKGRVYTKEHIQAVTAASKGSHRSEVVKRKMSAAQLGNKKALGYKHSEESCKRMSLSQMGNKKALGCVRSEETRRKMSLSQMGNKKALGYKHSEESCKKMSLSQMGNKSGAGNKGHVGRHHTEEEKRKIGLAGIGNKYALGYHHTEEAKIRISLSHIGNKSGAGNKGHKQSEEAKRKKSLAIKRWWVARRNKNNMCLVRTPRIAPKRISFGD